MPYGNTFANLIGVYEVAHREAYHFAPAQLANNRGIDERQISQIACQFEVRSDCLDLFTSKRSLLPDVATFVPRSVLCGDYWKLYSRHILPSIPPSNPKRRHHTEDGL
jgi:hypothetical protein